MRSFLLRQSDIITTIYKNTKYYVKGIEVDKLFPR
jgi:hypothetical protein